MAMTEQARHQLYEAMKEAIGVENADTLMEAFPPVGWADVATKHDLDVGLRSLANELRAEWRLEMRQQLLAIMAMNTTLVGLVVAAAKLV